MDVCWLRHPEQLHRTLAAQAEAPFAILCPIERLHLGWERDGQSRSKAFLLPRRPQQDVDHLEGRPWQGRRSTAAKVAIPQPRSIAASENNNSRTLIVMHGFPSVALLRPYPL
jgi:hypothetical protein